MSFSKYYEGKKKITGKVFNKISTIYSSIFKCRVFVLHEMFSFVSIQPFADEKSMMKSHGNFNGMDEKFMAHSKLQVNIYIYKKDLPSLRTTAAV